MAIVLVATQLGIRVFADAREGNAELAGHRISALAAESGGSCLAVVNEQDIWRRDVSGSWSKVAATGILLQSIVSAGGAIFAGGMDEAAVLRVSAPGEVERLTSFDDTPGRNEWLSGGPPLGVRGLTVTADCAVILAAVHVGGIPRSIDRGASWTSTIPIMFDVHEVRAHPSVPNLVCAAAAVGLCVSNDSGESWRVFSEGLETANSLAVAVLHEEALFSIQDGPFAKRSQMWRWKIGSEHLEQVREGLPEWLEGKVDTNSIAANDSRAAVLDGGGSLWLSQAGSSGWQRIATDVPYSCGLLVL